MCKMLLGAAMVALFATAGSQSALAGCYRLGATGYHWYRACIGPPIFYPHHRHCRRDWNGRRYCRYD